MELGDLAMIQRAGVESIGTGIEEDVQAHLLIVGIDKITINKSFVILLQLILSDQSH